jgi:hypothetical protein
MDVFINDNPINNKPNPKENRNVSIFLIAEQDKDKTSYTNSWIGNYFYIH